MKRIKRKNQGLSMFIGILGVSLTQPASAAEISCPNASLSGNPMYCFSPNTPTKSGEVNANFKYLVDLITAQNAKITALEEKLAAVSYDNSEKLLTISGANVQIINGNGSTNTRNGLGNLIVGYNEAATRSVCSNGSGLTQADCQASPAGTWATNQRQGSHNVVIGSRHNYTAYGGIVVGNSNAILKGYASVTGGYINTASGDFSSVSGGAFNTARAARSSVSGGYYNTASGASSSVSSGYYNTASGSYSSVSGGNGNTASGSYSSVSGGNGNTASGDFSSVIGGSRNEARGNYSAISGGRSGLAYGINASINGGRNNVAVGEASSVTGNWSQRAQNDYQVVP